MLVLVAATAALQQDDWHGFTPYPGARYLCYQRAVSAPRPDHGITEVIWHAYATPDPAARVARFYARAESTATVEQNGRLLRLGESGVLAIHPAAATNYPRCETAPAATDRTVIIASTMRRS